MPRPRRLGAILRWLLTLLTAIAVVALAASEIWYLFWLPKSQWIVVAVDPGGVSMSIPRGRPSLGYPPRAPTGLVIRNRRLLSTASAPRHAWFPDVTVSPSTWSAQIPFWIPALLFGLPAALQWRRALQQPAGRCPRCHYDRRGLPPLARCPECGDQPAHPQPSRPATSP